AHDSQLHQGVAPPLQRLQPRRAAEQGDEPAIRFPPEAERDGPETRRTKVPPRPQRNDPARLINLVMPVVAGPPASAGGSARGILYACHASASSPARIPSSPPARPSHTG